MEHEDGIISEEPRYFLASLSESNLRHLVTVPKDSVTDQNLDHFWGNEYQAILGHWSKPIMGQVEWSVNNQNLDVGAVTDPAILMFRALSFD